ncbi:hypothetical protein ACQP2K_13300 [Microbispora siamensis]
MHRTEDGRVALRFERGIRHSQAKVWRAITETGQLRAWFVVDDPGAAPALGAGWHAGLDALEALLDGRPAESSVGHELQTTYQRAFA